MSLLIKALHRAEQEKTADDKASASAVSPLELAPWPASAESPGANDLRPSPPARPLNQQASNIFTAKRAASNQAGLHKPALLAGAGLLSLLVIGGGFYFYLNSLSQPELVMPQSAVISQSTNSEALDSAPTPVNDISSDLATNDSANLEPSAPIENTTATTATQTPEEPIEKADTIFNDPDVANSEPADVVAANTARQKSAESSPQQSFGAALEQSEATMVKVTRNQPVIGINPALITAYEAFNAGDDATAQRNYRLVLQTDVRNVNALLGMAAVASRQGRASDALGWYGKVLELEPRNGVAQAAMVSLLTQADPVARESRIKNLLAQQPEAAHLHAALGSLYAEQNQWLAAQQAYFQAHHFDPANAEHAFNLAVTLDQIGKSALALQYYKTALELLTKSGASNIDRAGLESRIAQLE